MVTVGHNTVGPVVKGDNWAIDKTLPNLGLNQYHWLTDRQVLFNFQKGLQFHSI